MKKIGRILGLIAVMFFAGCAQMQIGSQDAKTTATGSAGGANSQNANSSLEHCSETLGTLAIDEDTSQPWFQTLQQQQLGPTTPVLKLLLQQTGCFVIVERGKAMKNIMGERALAQSGELRKTSKMHKGQMVAADYVLSPSITFSNNNAGGAGAAIGGLLGPIGAAIGGAMHSKESSTMLTLIDTRSSVQLAAAEGSAKNMDFGFVGGLVGGAGGGIGGGYSNMQRVDPMVPSAQIVGIGGTPDPDIILLQYRREIQSQCLILLLTVSQQTCACWYKIPL